MEPGGGRAEMKTLSCVIERLTRQGFTAHFGVVGNRLRAFESGTTFGVQEVVIREYERFEGVSDPDDMAIVYAIEILNGTRGWLVDAFGVYSSPAVSAFMQDVPIRRTVPDSSSGPSVRDRPPSGANGVQLCGEDLVAVQQQVDGVAADDRRGDERLDGWNERRV
jgi:hypothetical protein